MKTSAKLVSAVILMVVSLTLMVSVSFAWLTLSDSPALTGIKITIGGDNTIMIANDEVVETSDGKKVHIPGFFSKNCELEIGEDVLLSPVSTADGVNWFIPTISEDGEMIVNSIEDFTLDENYEYRNSSEGGYAYVDFWIVSPTDNTILRISSGDKTGAEVGSYAIELPKSMKTTSTNSGYTLDMSNDALASSLRVGFLVDDEIITENTSMETYMKSGVFRDEMTALKGDYESKKDFDFLIYEPNGLSHPDRGTSVILTRTGIETARPKEGEYWITNPIGLDGENNKELKTIAGNLIVQTENVWKTNIDTNDPILEEMYQSYLHYKNQVSLDDFYENFMQSNYVQYVIPGRFFEDTWDLYLSGDMRSSNEEQLSVLTQTNAVASNYIVHLRKNIPQRIRMYVWIEGQDVDCTYHAADQTVSLRFEFAGSTGA